MKSKADAMGELATQLANKARNEYFMGSDSWRPDFTPYVVTFKIVYIDFDEDDEISFKALFRALFLHKTIQG